MSKNNPQDLRQRRRGMYVEIAGQTLYGAIIAVGALLLIVAGFWETWRTFETSGVTSHLAETWLMRCVTRGFDPDTPGL